MAQPQADQKTDSLSAMDMLTTAPSRWCDFVDECSATHPGELQSIARQLDEIAERAARASAYIDARFHYGKTHAGAVATQNKRAKAVRKALGFSYPDSPLWF